MALTVREQAKYWGIGAAVFVLLLWFLGDVILPFILGGAIAYCLDPIADRMERMGLSRTVAVTLIALIAIFSFIVILLPAVSLISSQAVQLAQQWPDIVARFETWLNTNFPSAMDETGAIRTQLANVMQRLSDSAGDLARSVLSSAAGIVNILVLLVIVPVVAFYLLLDWDRMVARIDDLLPRDHVGTIRNLGRQIDDTLASFIRGQGTVMLIQGLFYAIALMLAGLNFGLVVGLIAGLLSFIPYVGAIVGGGLAIGLALFQFWGAATEPEWFRIGIVILIFVAGQVIEGNFLTPKLVGSSVGLHPVWLIFALSVFGALFGFVGLLVAVPVAAMIGVLTRFGIEQYQASLLYSGNTPPEPQPKDE